MTRIRATCPDCGEVDLQPDEVILRLVRDDEGAVATGSCYRFVCPACDSVVTKPADVRIAELLTTGGVAVEDAQEVRQLPPHPERPRTDLPSLTLDDLLDLHFALEDNGWFDTLVAAVG